MLRYIVALLAAAVVAAGGFFAYRLLVPASLPLNLPPPAALQVSALTPISPGGWTNTHRLQLLIGNRGVAGVDAEVKPRGQSFSDDASSALSFSPEVAQNCMKQAGVRCDLSSMKLKIPVKLGNGVYHWQARLHAANGVSRWLPYKGIIGVDTKAPSVYALSSSTDPDPTKTYHNSTLRFDWQGADTGSGIDGFAYRLDSDPHGIPATQVRTSTNTVTLNGIDTGTWYFHVRAVDQAGNWGSTISFPVKVDVTPPGLAHISFDRFDFNPGSNPLHVSFSVTRPAREVRVGVYSQSNGQLVRLYTLNNLATGQQTTVAWDGKDAKGNWAPAGPYEIYVRAVDAYGHSSVRGWNDFLVTHKRIIVSLGQQKLTAYDGKTLFLTSLVTTGNKALPTPVGTYFIMQKFHPFTFRSPWPKSSAFWYPPSKTEWAMLFREGGYFIHDAPWRSVFGPGSNGQIGTPGSNYTGTHGCINVPANVAQQLFAWAPPGTTVEVVP